MTISSISTAWMFDLFSRDVFKHCSSMLELGPQDLAVNPALVETYCDKYNLKLDFSKFINSVDPNFKSKQKHILLRVLKKIYYSNFTPSLFSTYSRLFYEKYVYEKPNIKTTDGKVSAGLELQKNYYSLFGINKYCSLDLFDKRADYNNDLNTVFTPK